MSWLNNWFQVIRREVRIMRSRPIYLLGSVGDPFALLWLFLELGNVNLAQYLETAFFTCLGRRGWSGLCYRLL